MKISKEFTTVTPLSKSLALTLFIVLPIVTFSLGMSYQSKLQCTNNDMPPKAITTEPFEEPVACTEEARLCPDGSSVGRTGPNCEFEKCPAITEVSKIFTGKITAINYGCHIDGECSVQIGKGNLILAKGESLNTKEVWGNFPADILNEKNVSKYIGKEVEVYAASVGGRTDSYTLLGNKLYYLRLIAEVQAFCGGIAGKICPDGYYCKYNGAYPDASGTCIKSSGTNTTYTCPRTQYVDCMPGPNKAAKVECSSSFLKWALLNCPNFKGAAL